MVIKSFKMPQQYRNEFNITIIWLDQIQTFSDKYEWFVIILNAWIPEKENFEVEHENILEFDHEIA